MTTDWHDLITGWVDDVKPDLWQTVANVAGDALDNGADFIYNNSGNNYVPPPPPPLPPLPDWMGNSDAGWDKGGHAYLPTSPNDTQFASGYSNDFGKITPPRGEFSKYNSYWLDGPQPPPTLSPWDMMWQGVVPSREADGPPVPPEGSDPSEFSWQDRMSRQVYLPPKDTYGIMTMPSLPPGTSM